MNLFSNSGRPRWPMFLVSGLLTGYMRQERSYRIAFASNDREIIEKIRSTLKSTHPIKGRKNDQVLEIIFHSKRLYEGLVTLGGFRRKSKTVSFPHVPKQYLRDFVRGYFDGDGSVFHVCYKATKNKKFYRELRSNFTSGSIKFLDSLMNVLFQELGLAKKILSDYDGRHTSKLGYGTKDTVKLLQYMYYAGFSIGLNRKAKFLQSVES